MVKEKKMANPKKFIFHLDLHDEENKEDGSEWNNKPCTTPTLFQSRLDQIKAINIRVEDDCMNKMEYD